MKGCFGEAPVDERRGELARAAEAWVAALRSREQAEAAYNEATQQLAATRGAERAAWTSLEKLREAAP